MKEAKLIIFIIVPILIFSSCNNTSNKVPNTTISIADTIINFNRLNIGDTANKTISILNTGKYPLIIYDVKTSCSCMKFKYTSKPVKPGKEIIIEIIYFADYPGYFKKEISLLCNTNSKKETIQVYGSVGD